MNPTARVHGPAGEAAAADAVNGSASSGNPVLCLCGAAAEVGGRTLWSGRDLEVQAVRVLGRRPGEAGSRGGYVPQRRSFDLDLRIRGVDIVRMGLRAAVGRRRLTWDRLRSR